MKISDKQYQEIGKATIHAVMNNRKVNRAISGSIYGKAINAILSKHELKPKKKWYHKLLFWKK